MFFLLPARRLFGGTGPLMGDPIYFAFLAFFDQTNQKERHQGYTQGYIS